jgi:hypothetical protein
LNWTSTTKADQRLDDEKHRSREAGDPARRKRPRPGAGHLGVNLVIDEIIPGAAGAAHGNRPGHEQEEVPEQKLR